MQISSNLKSRLVSISPNFRKLFFENYFLTIRAICLRAWGSYFPQNLLPRDLLACQMRRTILARHDKNVFESVFLASPTNLPRQIMNILVSQFHQIWSPDWSRFHQIWSPDWSRFGIKTYRFSLTNLLRAAALTRLRTYRFWFPGPCELSGCVGINFALLGRNKLVSPTVLPRQ